MENQEESQMKDQENQGKKERNFDENQWENHREDGDEKQEEKQQRSGRATHRLQFVLEAHAGAQRHQTTSRRRRGDKQREREREAGVFLPPSPSRPVAPPTLLGPPLNKLNDPVGL